MKAPFTPPNLFDAPRWKNLRVGLLGGSFNPPHAGHLHIARVAKAKFGLDCVWWIITPQNPLKDKKGIAPYEERYSKVSEMLKHKPSQIPTHIETMLGTSYTFQTIEALRSSYPKTDFLWICGMDNAHIFHQWDRWQDILDIMPMTFIARPPAKGLVKGCPVRQTRHIPHYFKTQGKQTDLKKPGIYWLSGSKMLDISSTKIRKNKKKQ
jgi:nicotinate-nucleotide adenylyltransferase